MNNNRGEYERLDGEGGSDSSTCAWASLITVVLLIFGGVAATVYFLAGPGANIEMWKTISTDDVKVHLENLYYISQNTTGKNRAAGTEGYNKSLAYVHEQLKTHAGDFYDFEVQYFEPVLYRSKGLEAGLTAPFAVPIRDFRVAQGSGSAALVGVDVVPVQNDGCKAADFTAANNGTVALIERLDTAGVCAVGAIVALAEKAGALGVVFVAGAGVSTRQTIGDGKTLSGIPAVVAPSTLKAALTSAGVKLSLAFEGSLLRLPTANLIATSKSGSDDNIIVIGSHLDSVPAGPGINDNGSGSSSNLAVALAAAKLGLNYTNKVRHAWWAAEEYGLLGSTHYAQSLNSTELNRILMCLNFDMLGSPNYLREINKINVNSTTVPKPVIVASIKIEQLFADFFELIGEQWIAAPIDVPGRSDYASFLAAGVPSSGLSTGAEPRKTYEEQRVFGGIKGAQLDPNYHEVGDDIHNINYDVLVGNVQSLAYTVQHLAQHQNATHFLYPNGSMPHHQPRGIKKDAIIAQEGFFL